MSLMRTIKQIIEDIEALTESAKLDDEKHQRHNQLQELFEELSDKLKENLNG